MRRWIIRILICAILGAITTVAIAWERAWTAPRVQGRYRGWSATDQSTGTRYFRMDRPGRMFLSSERAARVLLAYQSDGVPWIVTTPFPPPAPWPEEIEVRALLPRWSTIAIVDESASAESRWVAAFGWPAIAMSYGAACRVDEEGSVVPWTYSGAIDPQTGKLPNRTGRLEFRTEKFLPIHPVWPGFAIDTTLYGSTWLLLWLGFLGAKRAIRARQGLCPHCGYDLRGQRDAGCPECGWNRAA